MSSYNQYRHKVSEIGRLVTRTHDLYSNTEIIDGLEGGQVFIFFHQHDDLTSNEIQTYQSFFLFITN